jgi:epoxyqueuosine reductase
LNGAGDDAVTLAVRDGIATAARSHGFSLVGCAPLEPLPLADFLADWLAAGRAGEMRWLPGHAAAGLDPRQNFPWARSVISVALAYPPPPPEPPGWQRRLTGRVAAYAAGPDYHRTMRARLDRLAAALAARFRGTRYVSLVDTGPLLEREWARRAGVGWVGKNTLVLDRGAGSYHVLGELVTDLDVEPTPPPRDHCGSCTRCVDVCPTGALERDYTMDPRRCIAYLTIEHRGAIPPGLRPALANWVFGCDLCQEACPWNGPAAETGDGWLAPSLVELVALDGDGFARRYAGTSVARTGRRGLVRNAAVALGNSGNPDAVPALARALADRDPLVRGHAAWGLGRLGGAAARAALERARRREPSREAREEIDAALATVR